MSKVTFHGLPAWVGAIHGPTVCDFWTSDPAQLKWDRSLMSTIDLAHTPSAALAGKIQLAQIDADDFPTAGGRTTIGPLFPGGRQIGALWVSEAYLQRLGGRAPVVQAGAYDYEFMAVQYLGEHGDRRFNGYHAHLRQTNGALSLVDIWNGGTGASGAKPAGSWWIDLAADADPNAPPLAVGATGPLFLESKRAKQLTLIDTKVPPFSGGFELAA